MRVRVRKLERVPLVACIVFILWLRIRRMRYLEIRDALASVARTGYGLDEFDFKFLEGNIKASGVITNSRKVRVKLNGYCLLYLRFKGHNWIGDFENHLKLGLYESLGLNE